MVAKQNTLSRYIDIRAVDTTVPKGGLNDVKSKPKGETVDTRLHIRQRVPKKE